jgi:FdhE protein
MIADATTHDPLFPVYAAQDMIFPDPSRVFLDRSLRFSALAEGHSLAGWLSFLGCLTRAQHELLQEYPSLLLPDEAAAASAQKLRLPPVPALSWPRDPSWRRALKVLLREIAPHAPPPARETLERLVTMEDATLEACADRVLAAKFDGEAAEFLPFVAAALQVHWTALAARIDGARVGPPIVPGVCPCCGFLPVAAIVRVDGEIPGSRYLHCGLCNTEWPVPRVTCAACSDGNGIAYYHIEGSDGSIHAETCDACNSYLKIIYRKKSPSADPVADDLATLALTLLVEEAGYDHMNANLLLARP